MKKVLLSSALILAASGAFAQDKLVSKANSELKSEKPNFSEARASIKEALKNDETKNSARAWYVAGLVENKSFEEQRNLQLIQKKPNETEMYGSLLSSKNYWIKAAELDILPDAKGKVKPKYIKDIKKGLRDNQLYFYYGGAYFYEKQDYKNAYEFFNAYTEIPSLEMFAGEKETFKVDSNFHMMQFYAAVAASLIPSPELAVGAYEKLKGAGYKENEVFQYQAAEYLKLNDSVSYTNLMVEGAKRFPTESFYIQTLINIYINKNEFENAVAYLDDAIKQDPSNAQFYNVKARLLEEIKKPEEAIVLYKKAIEVKPDYADAYANIGRVFFNRAIEASDEITNIRNNREYEEAKKNKVMPLFKEALPYYEKAHEISPEAREYMVALRGIYYNLDMGSEMQKIEAKMAE